MRVHSLVKWMILLAADIIESVMECTVSSESSSKSTSMLYTVLKMYANRPYPISIEEGIP